MPPSWHIEALKAQAVAARSYAAFHINNSKSGIYDLENDTNSQMYNGIKSENPNSSKAVRDTKNIVMVYNNQPIKAFFHSHSGGITESPEKVWGQKVGYLKSVKSEYCNISKPLEWELKFDSNTLSGKLNKLGVGEINDIKILDTTPSGRVASLSIQGENGNVMVSGQDFRNLIGNTRIKSLLFDIVENENYFHIKGKGFGHGVGMSQYGSYGMAISKYNFEDILKYYYKDIDLVRIK
jgi:stage II sporulation protein D